MHFWRFPIEHKSIYLSNTTKTAPSQRSDDHQPIHLANPDLADPDECDPARVQPVPELHGVFGGLQPGADLVIDLMNDEDMWQFFATTGRYALITVSFQTILGFGLAMLVREKFNGSGLVTTLILIPMMLSPVVVGLFWKLMYTPTFGYFNYLIGFTNPAAGPDMLASSFARSFVPNLALVAVALVDVWMWTPFVMLLVLSGLKAIPDYLYEAAAIDRASSWFQFWRITLPQVMPLLMIAILFRTIEAFKSFDLVMGMTGGGPGVQTELIAINLYRQAMLGTWDTGRSSALAYMILIIILAVSNLYILYLNRMKGEA